MKWIRRIVLGLVAFVVVAVGVLLGAIHTDWGRDKIRAQVESALNDTFMGGGTVGKLEGSVFGDLVIRDLVINGPDHQPAITLKTVRIELELTPLIHKHAVLQALVVEDGDVLLKRNPDGSLQIGDLLKPSPSGKWHVELRDVVARRLHVALDGTNLDNISVVAQAEIQGDGTIDASVITGLTWRERLAPIVAIGTVHVGNGIIRIPNFVAAVAGAQAIARDVAITVPRTIEILEGVRVAPTPQEPMTYAGRVFVSAKPASVAQLAPGVELPGEVAAQIDIGARAPWTDLMVSGTVARQPVTLMAGLDLVQLRAHGVVATGQVDVGLLTGQRAVGTGTVNAAFDVRMGSAGELPVGSVLASAAGHFEGAPYAEAQALVRSTGTELVTDVSATGPAAKAQLTAVIRKAGDAFTLESSRILATSTSPETTSQGAAPVRGHVSADLAASGTLTPNLDLAVKGTLDAAKLRVPLADLSISTVSLAIDAQHIPAHPVGSTTVTATGVRRGDVFLRELALQANTRDDGKIAVTLRTRPKQARWLVDADALIDLGQAGDVYAHPGDPITIELLHHHVRAGENGDWKGSSGKVSLGTQRIALADFKTASGRNHVEASGEYWKAGAHEGDLVAHVRGESIDLSTVWKGFAGKAEAKVDVTRTNGRFAGTVDLSAKALTLAPKFTPTDATIHIEVAPHLLKANAEFSSLTMGSAKLVVDLDAPRDVTDTRAWQSLTRKNVRTLQLKVTELELASFAPLAGLEEHQLGGSIDGEVNFSATAIGGTLTATKVTTPWTAKYGEVTAQVAFAQNGPQTLAPSLVASIDGLGKISATANLQFPERITDPKAWAAIGLPALKGASINLDEVQVDPTWLARLGIESKLSGRVSGGIAISAGLKSVTVTAHALGVHGAPIVAPLDLDVTALVDGHGTQASITLLSAPQQLTAADRASPVVLRKQIELVTIDTTLPLTLAQLRANPASILEQPLNSVATIPNVPVTQVMGLIGRSDLQSGIMSGTIELKGTALAPKVVAHLAAVDVALPAGSLRHHAETLERMQIDAEWDGGTDTGRVEVSGTQPHGSLHVVAAANLHELKTATLEIDAKTFDLAPLLAFAPGPAAAARGRIDGKLTVTGFDPRTAKLAGKLHIKNARMPIAPQVGTLRRAAIDLVVGDDKMTIKIDGKLGAGTVKLDGTFGIAGAMPTGGELTLALRKVSPIGAVEPNIDADVTAKLTHTANKWVADVVIAHGNVDVPDERGEPLKEVGAPSDMVFLSEDAYVGGGKRKPVVKPPPAFPAFTMNITLQSTRIKSTELRGSVHGKLRIDIDPSFNVGLVGTIDADRGDLDLFGRRYQLDRAGVRFDGSIDPLLDVAISHDFPDVTTMTIVRGRVSAPQIILSSNPGSYSQGQLLGFLLGGEPAGEPADGNPRDKVTSAGASIIGNQIGGYVKDQLPFDIDVLKYEAATATSSQAVTVGSWLTRNLFLSYRQRFAARPDENSGEAALEYYLTRRLVIEGVVGNNNRNSADLLWRRRY